MQNFGPVKLKESPVHKLEFLPNVYCNTVITLMKESGHVCESNSINITAVQPMLKNGRQS